MYKLRCLIRFENAISTHPQITDIVKKLQSWLDVWVEGITREPPKFDTVFVNNVSARDHAIAYLSTNVKTIVDIVAQEQERLGNPLIPTTRSPFSSQSPASIFGVLFQYDMVAIVKMYLMPSSGGVSPTSRMR
jgi:hypothetical protein